MAMTCAPLLLAGAGAVLALQVACQVAPSTTEEVPTFFHFREIKGVRCNGTAYTYDKALGCNGWQGLTEHECKIKCTLGEALGGNCPQKLCFAASFYKIGGWCQLYDHQNCLTQVMGEAGSVDTYKKEHWSQGPAANLSAAQSLINPGALALAAVAALVGATDVSVKKQHAAAAAAAGAQQSTSLRPAMAGSSPTSPPAAATIQQAPSSATLPPAATNSWRPPGSTTAAPNALGSSGLGNYGSLLVVICLGCCGLFGVMKALDKRKRPRNANREYGDSDDEMGNNGLDEVE